LLKRRLRLMIRRKLFRPNAVVALFAVLEDERKVDVLEKIPLSILVWAAQMAVFHAVGLFFLCCDRLGWLSRYKVRRREPLTYREMLPRVLFNQIFILLPAMVALQYTGLAFIGVSHISIAHFVTAMLIMAIGHDIVQYVFHRFVLHRPNLIRRLGHSIHHSTGASISISACYMSPVDFFLEIALPYVIPLSLVSAGADRGFHILIASLGAIGGLYEHSGYDFAARLPKADNGKLHLRPLVWLRTIVSSQAHGEHHRRSNVSFSDGFGSPGICDTVFKTRWDLLKSGPTIGR